MDERQEIDRRLWLRQEGIDYSLVDLRISNVCMDAFPLGFEDGSMYGTLRTRRAPADLPLMAHDQLLVIYSLVIVCQLLAILYLHHQFSCSKSYAMFKYDFMLTWG